MKKYFEEKKRSLKFKLAGPGHKLTQDQSSSNEPSSSSSSSGEAAVPKRVDTKENQEQRSAMLAAALQRTQGNTIKSDPQLRLRKALAKELELDNGTRKNNDLPKESETESCKRDSEDKEAEGQESTAPGVFFKCPAYDATLVLSRPEWNSFLRTHIDELYANDEVLGSILQIKTFNSEEKASECIFLLTRYLKNIIDNPDVEKYRSIRMGNPKFSEKVLSVEGALGFLTAVGFEKEEVDDGTSTEPYLKFKRDSTSELEVLMNSLLEINGFTLVLDRDFHLFEPKEITNDTAPLPDDFFDITLAELKKQQQHRTTELERESMLRTKKMRESDRAKYAPRKALYTRIRVRLPNEHIIQGTFSVKEKFESLLKFIDEHIMFDSDFALTSPPSYVYNENDYEKTFEELNLQPAVKLILKTSSENIIFKNEKAQ